MLVTHDTHHYVLQVVHKVQIVERKIWMNRHEIGTSKDQNSYMTTGSFEGYRGSVFIQSEKQKEPITGMTTIIGIVNLQEVFHTLGVEVASL